MKQHYTQNEYKELLKYMRIVCQTNEQENGHILDWFDEKGIEYINRSIPEGDYNVMIKACPELGFLKDTYFYDELFIERKNSLQELASSLYGQKKTPAYAKKVIEEFKNEKIVSGLKLAKIAKEFKSQFDIYDDAFLRELKRAVNKEHKYLLVEQPSGWNGILTHDYPNDYNIKSYWAMLHTIELKYGLKVKFISKDNTALEIYTICKCFIDSKIDK